MIADYQTFLESKKLVVPAVGREVSADYLSAALFPFQRDLVRWSLRKGRAALFADTGLGKTAMQLEWARHAAARTLILAPLAVAQQTVREGEKFGIPVIYARRQEDAAAAGITITNYEMLSHFDPAAFGAVALDECFLAGTPVDTPDGPVPIESLRCGNVVLNAMGGGMITATRVRTAERLVVVHSKGCYRTTCSENHPWFTLRGWVRAIDLQEGDTLVSQRAAVRMVQGDFYSWPGTDIQTLLQSLLFSEMADAATGASRQGAHARSGPKTRRAAAAVSGFWLSRGRSGVGPHQGAESDDQPRDAGQGVCTAERDWPPTEGAGREREGANGAATDAMGGAWGRLGDGVRRIVGAAHFWISDRLQGRYRPSRIEDRCRGGRAEPLLSEGTGCEAGCEADFAWVDGIEILEQGDPRLDSYRGPDGRIPLYDLEVLGHPSFSVRGHLVHNSSILKAFEGKTRTALIEAFRRTPMRLCCTATPAPNDISEIANHAEFLGVMSRVEMLAAFFVHDDTGWRLKGHAREPFYRWLASWGMSLKKPSDLGYDDTGYNLPPLSITPHFMETDYAPEGKLFADRLSGVTERASVRRQTFAARTAAAAALIEAEHREPWIAWCGLNDEADRLTALIPGSVNVEGSQTPDQKMDGIERFLDGRARVLVTKPGIAGHGLNLQHCARMVFVGLGDSWEQYYQCVRRCWRFGQQRPVEAHVVLTDPERVIWDGVQRKERQAQEMARELVKHVAQFEKQELHGEEPRSDYQARNEMRIPHWIVGGHN